MGKITYHDGTISDSTAMVVVKLIESYGVCGSTLIFEDGGRYTAAMFGSCLSKKHPCYVDGDLFLRAISEVRDFSEEHGFTTVAIPYNLDYCLANGVWNSLEEIILDRFCKSKVDVEIWKPI